MGAGLLTFCPHCHNLLMLEASDGYGGGSRLWCQCCPYQYVLRGKLTEEVALARKEVDDVLGGEEAWANVAKTEAECPRKECGAGEAYFRQIQTRSADEPASVFYKCVKCGEQWREG